MHERSREGQRTERAKGDRTEEENEMRQAVDNTNSAQTEHPPFLLPLPLPPRRFATS